jgi:hypothetical protein
MKKNLLFLFAILASGGLFSQIVLLNENMDSYATNSFLGIVNPSWFTTWSNLPGSGEDAQILTNFAHSGTKSASADLTGGQTDCILKLGDKTSGRYELTWWMYVENAKCGYYNIQHFQTPGIEWAYEVYFRTSGAVRLYRGTSIVTGTYPKATWFEVKQIIKIDVDSVYLYINGTLLSAWPFHWTSLSTTGTNRLGGVDFFAGEEAGSGETPGFYFDDISYSQLGTLAPTVVTLPATGVTSTSATLNGTVNANIQSTTVTFEYGLTTAYGSIVPGVPATVTGNTVTPVSANITGLLPGNTYHYRVVGVNSIGTTNGLDMTFNTPPILPAVVTTPATGVGSTTATLNGTVNAGGASTTVTFDYGLTTAYGTNVPGVPGIVTGNTVTPVSANISGLTLNTTYHYRINGVNSVGTSNGSDMMFTTTSCPMPGDPGPITGPTTVCGNSTGKIYSVVPIVNATGYTWTVPPGAVITAGSNTNSITVTFGNSSGNVSVFGTNTCGSGSVSNLAVTVNPAPVPTITGYTTMCVNIGPLNYVTEPGMTNYIWTVSPGNTITGGQGTNLVQVSWTVPGAQWVAVNYTTANGCSAGTPTQLNITVQPLPGPAGTITGTASTCGGAMGVAYSVNPVANASTYVWTLPAGATIATGAYTNSITVNFAPNASSGNITVYGNNNCGNGGISPPFTVTVTPLPADAGAITGQASVCNGATGVNYTVPAIANATGYMWNVPAGATIASGTNTNSIMVDFSASAVSGIITVMGTNTCGNGVVSPDFTVTVNPVPPTPVITMGLTGELMSSAPAGNQWYFEGTAIPGATAQTYIPLQSGNYTCIVTINGCSSAVSNEIYVVMTGMKDHNNYMTVTLFPNPGNGQFTIRLHSVNQEKYDVKVINNLGLSVYEQKDILGNGSMEQTLDLRFLQAGIYWVVLKNDNTNINKKIIIR